MPDLAAILERESRTVNGQTGAFERLRSRRNRRQRNRRIGSAFVAIVLTTAAIAYAYAAFHDRAQQVPVDQISIDNVGELGMAWSADQVVAPSKEGELVVGGDVVYAGAGTATLEGLRLDCTTTREPCASRWSAGTASGHLYPDVLVGQRFLYAGWGETGSFLAGQSTHHDYFLATYPLSCGSDPCLPIWRTRVSHETGVSPVAEVGNRLYVTADRSGRAFLEAFPLDCSRSVCHPIWSADRADIGPPVLVDGQAIVLTKSGVVSFDARCWNERGPACRTVWIGHVSRLRERLQATPPVVVDGHVFVDSRSGVASFSTDCRGACSPEWIGRVPGGPGFPPIVDDGLVVSAKEGSSDLYAFAATCHTAPEVRSCSPKWIGHTSDGVGYAPVVRDGVVLTASPLGSSVSAFPTTCSGTCAPSWVAHLDDSIQFPPVETNGLVYVAGIETITVFPTQCADPCPPAFSWSLPNGVPGSSPVVSGDTVLVLGRSGGAAVSDLQSTLFAFRPGAGVGAEPSTRWRPMRIGIALLIVVVAVAAGVLRRRSVFR